MQMQQEKQAAGVHRAAQADVPMLQQQQLSDFAARARMSNESAAQSAAKSCYINTITSFLSSRLLGGVQPSA
jgi:hypothetical protein